MKIYIDVSVLTLATFVTGIQRVTRELTVRLIEDERFEVVLLHYNARENCYHQINNKKFCDYYTQHLGVKERMITRKSIKPEDIGKGDIFLDLDAAWMSRLKRSYLLPVLKAQGVRIVAHIYDIISIRYPQYCLERGVYNFMDYIGAHLQYADALVVNAKATAEDLRQLADQTGIPLPLCHVIPLGADFGERGEVDEGQIPESLRQAVGDAPYLLMVGTIEPRKNHKLLLEAYDRGLKDLGYHIILAGYMGWNMEEFAGALKEHPDYGKGIFHFESLSDERIDYLYQHAKFLVFCSYIEGFGLPIIEALFRGLPVLAADVPVLREVGGDYCVWFEQDHAEELCEAVKYYDAHEEAYQELRERTREVPVPDWRSCFHRLAKVLLRIQT